MNFSIIVFPGSNCDKDCYDAVSVYDAHKATYVWYKEEKLPQAECVIIPGGFSYGDYLRPGAIAKTAPIVNAIKEFAHNGGLVIGICNGFQILTEIGLLPGSLMTNESLKFICQEVYLKVETTKTPFTNSYSKNQVIDMPIAHMDGNYFADAETLKTLEANDQIIFRYCEKEGQITEKANPNGSISNIAGICNKEKNVLGLMPHPERNIDELIGSGLGIQVFKSIENSLSSAV